MPTIRKTINNGNIGGTGDFKVQLASDASGQYVEVVSLDNTTITATLNPGPSELTYNATPPTLVDGQTVSVQGDSSGRLLTSTTGTVTANAGTNLNTSLLAVESGGNLATIAGAVSGGKVQTTVATALPAGTNTIGKVDQGVAGASAWKVDPSGVTSPISVASLPLPSNAAKETGGNLDTLAGAVSGGQVQVAVATALPAGSNTIGSVDIASNDTVIGPTNETAPVSDTATSGLNGRLQRIAQRLTSLIALLPTALTGSGNLKVALVESTASQTVSGTVTANAGTNLNTSSLALESGGNIATMVSNVGQINDAAPGTDTASASLNGRLQRIAQRLTSLIGLVPTSLTGSGNFKVALVENTTTQSITGTVTANAGTNLNTSALALENGGNLATIAGAVSAGQVKTTVATALPAGSNTVGGVTLPDIEAGLAAGTAPAKMIVGGVVFNTVAPTPTNGQTVALQSDSAGNLKTNIATALPAGSNTIGIINQGTAGVSAWKVDGSGVTQPVSGTITATQGTAGVSAWKVDGSGVIQPVSGTVSAAQSGNWSTRTQDGSGTAITSTASALDINVKSGTVITNADAAIGAGTAPSKALVGGAVYNSTEISPTTGQTFAVQGDSKGRQRMVLMDAAGNTRGANINASNQLSVSTDGDGFSYAQGSTTSGQTGRLVQGAVTTSAPTYTTGQTNPLSLTTKGGQRVALIDSSGNEFDYTVPTKTSRALLNPSDLSAAVVNISTATTTAIVAAVIGQTTRVHRVRLNVAAAQSITVKDGSTTLEVLNFTTAGFLTYDVSGRPWYTTSTNSALNFTTSTTAQVNGVAEYVTSA